VADRRSSRFYTMVESGRLTYCTNGCIVLKGQMRLRIFTGNGYYGRPTYSHYCLSCAYKVLNDECEALTFLIVDLDRIKREELQKEKDKYELKSKW